MNQNQGRSRNQEHADEAYPFKTMTTLSSEKREHPTGGGQELLRCDSSGAQQLLALDPAMARFLAG
ncbi:hypothetical protein KQ304_00250 [Synechococcus sp. CS-1329]|nr:hypothetical protein [Synechococcus sp. CS-1329]